VSLDVRVEEPPVMVSGDASRLQQVFWNLLSNAIKFTPAGGHVTVVQRIVQGQACVEVSDNGHGIDPVFLPYVFERFRQADGSITRRHGGLGLGLSIARSLVQMHGGTIEAASGGLDQGSTFFVRIPLAVATRTPDADVSRAPTLSRVPLSAGMLAGLSVLAVDDDEDARVLVRDILTSYGADVMVAADAETALELFRRRTRPFDLLVSDIGMPGMDGYALLRALRVEAGDRPVAAVAVTAYASAEDSARVYAAGYRIHVPKPATPHEIVAACAIASERVVV
jgi:CheY-like chemotaxis protein